MSSEHADDLLDEPDGGNDHFGFHHDPKRVNRLIRDIVIVLWTFIICIKLFYDFYRSEKNKPTGYKPLKYAALSAIGFYGIGYIISIVEIFTLRHVRYFFYGSLNIALGSSYIFILLQLYYSFRSSMYRMNKSVFYLHGILCTFSEIFFAIWAIMDYQDIHPWKLYAVAIGGFFWFMGILHLVYSFGRNLFLVILAQRRTITVSHQLEIELSMQQLNILYMIVKHTVLSCFQMACYVLLCIIVIILAIIDHLNKAHHELYSIIRMWCLVLSIIIVSICIHLSFAINNSLYLKMCGKCDRLCKNTCQKLATNSLQRQNKNLYEYAQL